MASKVVAPIAGSRSTLRVPGDKSISHRSAIIGAIAEGETRVEGFLTSEDCLNTVRAVRAMGVPIERDGESVTIGGVGLDGLREPSGEIDVGNSGTSIRLLAGLAAGQAFRTVLTGDGSVRRRPMDRVVGPLRLMGARIQGAHGDTRAPLEIVGGGLTGIRYDSPVASAQVKSAILLAGLYAEGETTVLEPARSRDHTERMLTAFGAELRVEDSAVVLSPRPTLAGRSLRVPGDMSSAAFFIVAGALLGEAEIVIEHVGVNETRSGILDALITMGADIVLENAREAGSEAVADVRVRSSRLQGVTIHGEQVVRMIDEIPVLALAASQAAGETVVRDAAELRVKETDRISTVAETLGRLGVEVRTEPDGFRILGPQRITGGVCESSGDHRIAMMAAVAGLIAEGPVTVDGVECIDTSFPGFWETLGAL